MMRPRPTRGRGSDDENHHLDPPPPLPPKQLSYDEDYLPAMSDEDLSQTSHPSMPNKGVLRKKQHDGAVALPAIASLPDRPGEVRIFEHPDHRTFDFTNCSPHPVLYQGQTYPRAEHLFHALKVRGQITLDLGSKTHKDQFLPHRPLLARHIETCGESPGEQAKLFSKEIRSDWHTVSTDYVSELLGDIESALKRATPDVSSVGAQVCSTSETPKQAKKYWNGNPDPGSEIQQIAPITCLKFAFQVLNDDVFWGVNENGAGQNEFGKALMTLRDKYSPSG